MISLGKSTLSSSLFDITVAQVFAESLTLESMPTNDRRSLKRKKKTLNFDVNPSHEQENLVLRTPRNWATPTYFHFPAAHACTALGRLFEWGKDCDSWYRRNKYDK